MLSIRDPRVRRLRLIALRAVEEWLGGQYRSVFRGLGVAFEEVREYQPGDDVRTIDWNVTARTGLPHVKRFVDERELTVMLALDCSSTMSFGSGDATKYAAASEAAAAVALAALSAGDRVGLCLFHDRVVTMLPPRKGPRHALRICRELTTAPQGAAAASFEAVMSRLMRLLHRRTLLVLASDFLSPNWERTVTLAAARHDTIALWTHDPWERELPDVGFLNLFDPTTSSIARLDTSRIEVRTAYRDRMAVHADRVRQSLRQAKVGTIELTAGSDTVMPLRTFFEHRRKGS